jgi:1-acyl-sn-glycerol-3-phosphate acyltransferase
MMKVVRACRRLVLVGLVLPPGYVISLSTWLLWPFSPQRARGLRTLVFHLVCGLLLRILGVRVSPEGSELPVPSLLVSNHLGYLDILVFGSLLRCVFVSRDDVRHWPVVGLFARESGTIFLERKRRGAVRPAILQIRRQLESGTTVIFFPEGTSGSGDELMPFKPSLFEAAVAARAPVRCAAIHYRTLAGEAPARESVCWWGDMTFLGHVWNLLGLSQVEAHVRFAPEILEAVERKELALATRRIVLRELDAVVALR